jgi:serine/threonine protein phosphatase PrpC
MRDDKVDPHVMQKDVAPGKILLLCSDGLWNYFQEPGELLSAINQYGPQKDLAEICTYLVDRANEQGGHDNITVAMLKM